MSTSITAFPFSADKISELPAVTSLLASDKIVVNAGATPATSTITRTLFEDQLDFQPHTEALDLLAELPATESALFLINTLMVPETHSYLRINASTGQTLPRTFAQVRSDIAAQPSDATLDALALVALTDIGTSFLELITPSQLDVPSQYYYARISGGTGNAVSLRTAAQTVTDIGAMPLAYLVTALQIAVGARIDDAHVPSTLAMARYVDARTGGGVKDDSDDTIASATLLDLDSTTGTQIDVTGTTAPTTITLAEGDQKIVRFKGAMTIVSSATINPGGRNIVTTVDSWATFIGLADGVVQITNYYPDEFYIQYGGDFSTGGTFTTGGDFEVGGDFAIGGDFEVVNDLFIGDTFSTAGAFSTIGGHTLALTTTAVTALTLPTSGLVSTEVGNYSTAAQTPAAATRTYITGSAITVPTSRLKIGTKLTWKFNMTKTAAGSAASTIDICVGTAGTTADTARVSFTKPAGTAAADEGFVVIEAICRGPLSASGVMVGQMTVTHNLENTGHMIVPIASVNTVSSAFDVTTAGLKVGVCITSGAADSLTIQQVSAQAFNI